MPEARDGCLVLFGGACEDGEGGRFAEAHLSSQEHSSSNICKEWTMPQDGAHEATKESATAGDSRSDWRDMFAVPEAAKRVFRKFPLVTYSPNQRPLRSPTQRDAHTLYIWTTVDDAENDDASFNPTCLKWQVRYTRAPSATTAGLWLTRGHLDVSQVLWHCLPDCLFKQPRLAHRNPSFPPTSCHFCG